MNIYIFESIEQDKAVHRVEITCFDSAEWYVLDKVDEYFDRLFNEAKMIEFFKTSANYVTLANLHAKVNTFFVQSYHELISKLYYKGISDIGPNSPEGYDKIYADKMYTFFSNIINS